MNGVRPIHEAMISILENSFTINQPIILPNHLPSCIQIINSSLIEVIVQNVPHQMEIKDLRAREDSTQLDI